MVKAILTIAFILAGGVAHAITPDELRAMSSEKSSEKSRRSQRLNSGSVDAMLPPAPRQQKPSSSKYEASESTQNKKASSASQNRTPKKSAPSAKQTGTEAATDSGNTQGGGPEIYVSPFRGGSQAQASTAETNDAVPASLVFGIRLGTWVSAKLNRNASSAEPGDVELTVTEDVIGDNRTLPAGTLLFAAKTLNNSTKRMDLTVIKGITPNGKEFKMRGLIYDPQKIAGLPGIYTVDEKEIAKHGLQKGTVAAVGAAAQSVGMSNPLSAAGTAATQSVLTDTGGAVEYNAAKAVIYISPQPLIIRVEERF